MTLARTTQRVPWLTQQLPRNSVSALRYLQPAEHVCNLLALLSPVQLLDGAQGALPLDALLRVEVSIGVDRSLSEVCDTEHLAVPRHVLDLEALPGVVSNFSALRIERA